jgi:hypothetical protein
MNSFEARNDHRESVAVLAIEARVVAMASRDASTSSASPCRSASHIGSLYESHVVPEESCQTSALRGKSIPIV